MLLQKYPELKQHVKHMKTYKRLTPAGELIEQWELIDGQWKETTEIVKARERIAALRLELAKMSPQNDAEACPEDDSLDNFDELL